MARFSRALLIVAGILVLAGCQKRGLQELVREELFSLTLGKMEDQVDLFQLPGQTLEHKNRIYMRDGLFTVANGNSGKIMVFSSYGDLIFLLYNPATNPPPALPAPAAGDQEVSTRAAVAYPFKNIGEIAVSSEKTFYVEDDAPEGKAVRDEKTGVALGRVVLRFDRRGVPQGYIGQEGVGGTPFPYVMSLTVTSRDQLVVVGRTPTSWQVFWYSREGALLYQVEIDQAHLPESPKLTTASLTSILPDMQNPLLYLVIYYFKEATDETTRTATAFESVSSRVYRLNLRTRSYESFVELPQNARRKEKVGFKSTEIASPPNEVLGVNGGGSYYLLGFLDPNLYALTVLDPGGRVRERRYMVIEDSELTYRDLHLSPTGMIYGLLCDQTRAHVSWWRSDLLLKGD
jgi:hypothetical protein